MCKKSGPSGIEPVGFTACSKAKMFHTVAALILVNLDMDAALDKVPMMVLFPSAIFSATGRSMRQSFFQDEIKCKPAKTSDLSRLNWAVSVHLDK